MEQDKEILFWKQLAQTQQMRATEATNALAEAKRTSKMAIISLGAVSVCALIVAGTLFKLPIEKYIFTDNAKAICEAQSDTQPYVTTNTVLDFAKDCVLDLDSVAYDTIDRDLLRTGQRCFLPGFRKRFFESAWLGERIDTVKSGLFRVSPETTSPPLIESEEATAMGYKWTVQVPIKRTYMQGNTKKGTQERVYRAEVYRVTKDAHNPVGLGINALEEKSR